jgi:hypothetical protein
MHRVAITGVTLGDGSLLAATHIRPRRISLTARGRFGTGQGTFTVEERRSSWFAATEYSIAYQKQGSGDRAVVIYNRRNGPVTVQSEITFGNHAEIAGAVRAIELCAQPR